MSSLSSPFPLFADRFRLVFINSSAHIRLPRGAILILVVAVLGLLLVLGTAFITVTRQDLATTSHLVKSTQADLAAKTAINAAAEVIRRDLFDPTGRHLLTGGVQAGAGGLDPTGKAVDALVGEYMDYPDPSVDEWLSPIDPEGLDPYQPANNFSNSWVLRNVARIGQPLPPPPGGRDFRNPANCRDVPYYPAPDRQLADVDGDGLPDGIWCILPNGSVGGEQWEAAYKIIDLSGLVNLNTAIRPLRSATETAALQDLSAEELGRYHTGAQPNGYLYEPFLRSFFEKPSEANPGEYWNLGFYQTVSLANPWPPTKNLQLWHMLGVAINPRSPARWPAGGNRTEAMNSFGLSDELEFRFCGGISGRTMSSGGSTPSQSGRTDVCTLLEAVPHLDPGVQVRRYFTALSAVANYMAGPPLYSGSEDQSVGNGNPSGASVHQGLLRGETSSSNATMGKSLSVIKLHNSSGNSTSDSDVVNARQYRASVESLVYRICNLTRQQFDAQDANPDLNPEPMPGFKVFDHGEIRPTPGFRPTDQMEWSNRKLEGVSAPRLQRWWYLKELADVFLVALDGYLGANDADSNPFTGDYAPDSFMRADGSGSQGAKLEEKLRDQHALMAAHLAANSVDYCDADNVPTLFTYIYQNPWSPQKDKRKLVRVMGIEHAPILSAVKIRRSGMVQDGVSDYDSAIAKLIASAYISDSGSGGDGQQRAQKEMVNGDYYEVELFNPFDSPLYVYILPRNQTQQGSVFATNPLPVSPSAGKEFGSGWESFRDPKDTSGGTNNRFKRRIFPRTVEFFLGDAKSNPARHYRVFDQSEKQWKDYEADREDDFALPMFVAGTPWDSDSTDPQLNASNFDPDRTQELMIEPYRTNASNSVAAKFRLIVPAVASMQNLSIARPTAEQVPYTITNGSTRPLQLRLRLDAEEGSETRFNDGPPPDPFVVNASPSPSKGVYLFHRDNPAAWLDALGRDGKLKARVIPQQYDDRASPYGTNNSVAGCSALFSPDIGISLTAPDSECDIHMSKPVGKNPRDQAVALKTLQMDSRAVSPDKSGLLPDPFGSVSASQPNGNEHCSPLARWFTPVDLNRISTFGGVYKIPKSDSYPADSAAAYMDTWCDRATWAQAAIRWEKDAKTGKQRPRTGNEKYYLRRTAGRIDWLRPNQDYTFGGAEWKSVLDQERPVFDSFGGQQTVRRSGRRNLLPETLKSEANDVFYDYDLLTPGQRLFLFLSKYDPHLDTCNNDINSAVDVDGGVRASGNLSSNSTSANAQNNPLSILEGTLYGQININTAPARVLQYLPWSNKKWSEEEKKFKFRDQDPLDQQEASEGGQGKLASAILAYRAKTALRDDVYQTWTNISGENQRSQKAPDRVRRGYGFLSVGELMNLIANKNEKREYNIDRLGGFSAEMQGPRYDFLNVRPDLNYEAGIWTGCIVSHGPGEFANHVNEKVPGGDKVLFDLVERDLLFRNVSSMITTRSDVFCVYVLVRSRHVATNRVTSFRRMFAIIDRTQVRTLQDAPIVYGPYENTK